ncbi:hypothetical protein AVEN_237940-1 [Araneus ventricosus]|uniref:Uncharacterized protein n=1 Tax=Araneus ventricosus TaxID=182803 RepID=A0A4Y2VAB2_ARAVE|nr:hypothetical protein AVEN_237940-1 [Araneus ventricosus]
MSGSSCVKQQQDGCSEPHKSGKDVFTMLDDMQCKTCGWVPVKTVTSFLKVEYVLNHQCETCQFQSFLFRFGDSFVGLILSFMEPRDGSPPDMGRGLGEAPSRPYDEYDYLYCKTCNNNLWEFHEELPGASDQRVFNRKTFRRSMCHECIHLTRGELLEKTYQVLPKCCVCNELVEHDRMFLRLCCRMRHKKKYFHVECSRKHAECPNCRAECKIQFEIPNSDTSLQEDV